MIREVLFVRTSIVRWMKGIDAAVYLRANQTLPLHVIVEHRSDGQVLVNVTGSPTIAVLPGQSLDCRFDQQEDGT